MCRLKDEMNETLGQGRALIILPTERFRVQILGMTIRGGKGEGMGKNKKKKKKKVNYGMVCMSADLTQF